MEKEYSIKLVVIDMKTIVGLGETEKAFILIIMVIDMKGTGKIIWQKEKEFFWKCGNRNEGDFINYKFEGKGKFYLKNGDRYEGDTKMVTEKEKGFYGLIVVLNMKEIL